MRNRSLTNAARLSCRIYDWVLRLYPAGLRSRFGDEMRMVFADQINSGGTRGWNGFYRTWSAVAVELWQLRVPGELDFQRFGVPAASIVASSALFLLLAWAIGIAKQCHP